jgi:hypothetical protein
MSNRRARGRWLGRAETRVRRGRRRSSAANFTARPVENGKIYSALWRQGASACSNEQRPRAAPAGSRSSDEIDQRAGDLAGRMDDRPRRRQGLGRWRWAGWRRGHGRCGRGGWRWGRFFLARRSTRDRLSQTGQRAVRRIERREALPGLSSGAFRSGRSHRQVARIFLRPVGLSLCPLCLRVQRLRCLFGSLGVAPRLLGAQGLRPHGGRSERSERCRRCNCHLGRSSDR